MNVCLFLCKCYVWSTRPHVHVHIVHLCSCRHMFVLHLKVWIYQLVRLWCFLICVGDSNSASWAASVAQMLEHRAWNVWSMCVRCGFELSQLSCLSSSVVIALNLERWKVVGSNPTWERSFFFCKWLPLTVLCDSCCVALSVSSVSFLWGCGEWANDWVLYL